jgi:hypothetical protein
LCGLQKKWREVKWKFLPSSGLEHQTLDRPARSQSLHQLRHSGSSHCFMCVWKSISHIKGNRLRVPRMKSLKATQICIMRSFIICTPREMMDGTWGACTTHGERRETHTVLWRENLNKRDHSGHLFIDRR